MLDCVYSQREVSRFNINFDKGNKTRSTSDDAGGKSVIKKSQATRTSQTPFEASKGETEKHFVDSLKDKRTGKKCPEFLIE